jgi:hypothetical protein
MRAGWIAPAYADSSSAFEPGFQPDSHVERAVGDSHALHLGAASRPGTGHLGGNSFGADSTASSGDGERESTADAKSGRERAGFAGGCGESGE